MVVDAYGMAAADGIDAVLDAQAALARRKASRPRTRDRARACHRHTLAHEATIRADLADATVAGIRPRSSSSRSR